MRYINSLIIFLIATTLSNAAGENLQHSAYDGCDPDQDRNKLVECYIGQYMARVMPERIRIFTAPAAGVVTDLLDKTDFVRKGTIIAKINEVDIELERKELQLALLKDKTERREEIHKLNDEKEEYLAILALPQNQRKYWEKGNNKVVQQYIVNALEDKIKLIESEMEVLAERKKADFDKKEESYYIKMPFDGRVQYSFSLKEKEDSENYVEASKDIASVFDDSAFYLSIHVSSPEISRLDPHVLKLIAELGNGEVISGKYSHKRIEKSQSGSPNSETWVYYFKITDESLNQKSYEQLLAVNYVGKLYYQGDSNVIAISKMKLATLPEAKTSESWQQLIEKVKPGYELILVGETQIIARKK